MSGDAKAFDPRELRRDSVKRLAHLRCNQLRGNDPIPLDEEVKAA